MIAWDASARLRLLLRAVVARCYRALGTEDLRFSATVSIAAYTVDAVPPPVGTPELNAPRADIGH